MPYKEIVKQLKKMVPKTPFSPSVAWLNNVVYGSKKVSPERAVMIEKITDGRITRMTLRPDFFKIYRTIS